MAWVHPSPKKSANSITWRSFIFLWPTADEVYIGQFTIYNPESEVEKNSKNSEYGIVSVKPESPIWFWKQMEPMEKKKKAAASK